MSSRWYSFFRSLQLENKYLSYFICTISRCSSWLSCLLRLLSHFASFPDTFPFIDLSEAFHVCSMFHDMVTLVICYRFLLYFLCNLFLFTFYKYCLQFESNTLKNTHWTTDFDFILYETFLSYFLNNISWLHKVSFAEKYWKIIKSKDIPLAMLSHITRGVDNRVLHSYRTVLNNNNLSKL